VKLAIDYLEQSIKEAEREISDSKRCEEQCQAQLDDASRRVARSTGKLKELRAVLAMVMASQKVESPEIDVTNLRSAEKALRLEKRRA